MISVTSWQKYPAVHWSVDILHVHVPKVEELHFFLLLYNNI